MGEGIDLAKVDNPLHATVMENFRDQLLVALVKKMSKGKEVRISVADVDATGGFVLLMRVENGDFVFSVQQKR